MVSKKRTCSKLSKTGNWISFTGPFKNWSRSLCLVDQTSNPTFGPLCNLKFWSCGHCAIGIWRDLTKFLWTKYALCHWDLLFSIKLSMNQNMHQKCALCHWVLWLSPVWCDFTLAVRACRVWCDLTSPLASSSPLKGVTFHGNFWTTQPPFILKAVMSGFCVCSLTLTDLRST